MEVGLSVERRLVVIYDIMRLVIMKYCTKCETKKSITAFYKDRSRKDGLTTACKNCRRIYLLQYRRTSESWKETHRKAVRKYKRLNYQKRLSRDKAIDKKEVLLKDKCEKCEGEKNLQMHHFDYSKPYRVKTLCQNCHMNLHYPDRNS